MKTHTCLVIGLDGADPHLVWPWAQEGKLPHLGRLMARGVHGPLHSTYPPISAAAWVTFMTGQQPARHGIFDFRNFDARKYDFQDAAIVSSAPIAGHTVMDAVGAYGRRVAAVTIPITFPAWPINGVMVSGYPTPDASKAFTYPPELAHERKMGRLTENSALFRAASPEAVRTELNRLTHARTQAALEMLRQDHYDLFILVLGATDRAHHDFWKYHDPAHPAYDPQAAATFGDAVLQTYQEVDIAVGALLDAVGEEATVIVMSDHGGGPRPSRRFNLNAWLRSLGLLTTNRRPNPFRRTLRHAVRAVRAGFPYQEQLYRALPVPLQRIAAQVDSDAKSNSGDILWNQTQAYRFPMHSPVDGIVLNVRGRQREGVVSPDGEYEALRERIISALLAVRDPETGQPVVAEVVRREELYTGPYLERMPDLVVTLHADYEGGAALDGPVITPVPPNELARLSGAHRMQGILMMAGAGIHTGESVEGARIVDLAPTMLYAMGLPVPRRMEGRVLLEAFRPDYRRAHPVAFSEWSGEQKSDDGGYSDEDEQAVLEQLRRLGYVE